MLYIYESSFNSMGSIAELIARGIFSTIFVKLRLFGHFETFINIRIRII